MPVTTKERVFEIADELDSKGVNPTLAAVRKGLGGGSFTTISEAMTIWRTRKAAKDRPVIEPAPQAISERITELGAEIWTLAVELAYGRLETERETLSSARAQIEAEKKEAAELADQLTDELDAAKNRVASLEAAEIAARSEANRLREQVTSLNERVLVGETRIVEIEKRVLDLNGELARVNEWNSELLKVVAESVAGKEGQARTTKKGKASIEEAQP